VTAPNAQPVFSFLLRFLCLPYTGLSNLVDYEDCVFVALHMSQNTTGDLTKTRAASRMSESCRDPRCRFVIDQRGVIFSIPLRQESTGFYAKRTVSVKCQHFNVKLGLINQTDVLYTSAA
jgi:hypothetical protein